MAAAASDSIDTYVSALSKICGSVLAARLAGVSCMASAHLKERLNHLMSYHSLRKRALSHPFIVTAAAILVLSVTALSGLDAAATSDPAPYSLTFTARPGDLPNQIEFSGRVFETATGLVLARPTVFFLRGSEAHITSAADNRQVIIDVRDTGEKVVANLRVVEHGQTRQETTHSAVMQPDGPRNRAGRRYTGAAISLNLRDAKLTDVLDNFGKLTGIDIKYPPGLEGRVTLDIRDMPWDQAFDLILREHGLIWEMDGKTLVVVRE
jgi:hypothetical protein